MIISIASGKGGTGKTTVAVNLAAAQNHSVQLLDCDVEAPNAHLFLNLENIREQNVTTMVPEVDLSLCDQCGACGEICQFSAITSFGEVVMTFPEMCHSCMGCVMVCPTGAVRESSRDLGKIIMGNHNQVSLAYGALRIGEAMSPPLIQAVKEKMTSSSPVIIDAPPGTSCPMIAAVRDTDFVILVTEPTPFGLNDLTLAVETVRSLEIPFGIVLNRCDIGDDRTLDYAEKEKIPILMEIPDRREIAEAYSRGQIIIDAFPEMKAEFQSLYEQLEKRSIRDL